MLSPRQAIETKYLGPTNHKGARIVTRCDAKRTITPWDHALNAADNHAAAAVALGESLGWGAPTHLASTQNGYVAVYADEWSSID